ncbi:hypothetical protein H311_01752 [Anncaliia algerae PRA109]|nr:hypothetical protein H311_01752 [Anncaliia algerae PRA109]
MIEKVWTLIFLLTPIFLLGLIIYTFIDTKKYIKTVENNTVNYDDNIKYKELINAYEEYNSNEIFTSKLLLLYLLGLILLILIVIWGNLLFYTQTTQNIALFFTKLLSSDRLPVDKDSIFTLESLRAFSFQFIQLYFVITFFGAPILLFILLYLILFFNQAEVMQLLIPSNTFDFGLKYIVMYFAILWIISILMSFLILYLMSFASEDPKSVLSNNCYKLANENFDYIIVLKNAQLNFANGLIFNQRFLLILGDISNFTEEEVFACILHEIGHRKSTYLIVLVLLQLFVTIFVSGVIYLLIDNYVNQTYSEGFSSLKVTFLIINLPIISILNGLILNYFSFIGEYHADLHVKESGYSDHLANALLKLNIKNSMPSKMSYFTNLLLSSHPCNYFRIKNIY